MFFPLIHSSHNFCKTIKEMFSPHFHEVGFIYIVLDRSGKKFLFLFFNRLFYHFIIIFPCIILFNIFYSQNLWLQFIMLSKSESVKFSLIEPVICLFTDLSMKKYFSLLNQLIFTNSSVKKIFLTVKSVNFHWNNQWNFTDLQ